MKMLINAQRQDHLRVAIIDGTSLEDFQVEIAESGLTRGNIYRGVVANVQPSLNAAFIDIDEDRHGFLPMNDVLEATWHKKPPKDEKRPRIEQVLERGKPILVQVAKDSVGQKGAALTTNLALAGRYLVLTPFDGVRGISRKADDDDSRKKARQRLGRLSLPDDGSGVIMRTNGLDQNQTTLNRDLNALLRLWKRVRDEGNKGRGPRLLYSDQDLLVQGLSDYLDSSIDEVLVDNDDVHQKAEEYMRAFMPRSKTRLTRYQERRPLFSRFNLEPQIEAIYERRVPLPSGGSLVIDTTEALTAIDVNSGRATQAATHDETIFNVNVEAAQEVGRQLRLRDIGGLVVIDFIDMRLRKHQRKLEKAMRDAMKADRARCAVGRVSSNGLLEINRQRIKQSLRHRTHRPCPACQGVGSVPIGDFAALTILRRIEARVSGGTIEAALAILHPEIADALQNHHRRELAELEREFDMRIEVVSSPTLTVTQDRIEWTHREGAPKSVRAAAPAVSATAISEGQPSGRGRRRKSDDETADLERKKTGRQRSAKQDEEAEAEESGSTRRRRRRGGRGRRRKSEDASSEEVAAKAQEETSGRDEAEQEEEKPKSRRGRSSRSRRSTAKAKAAEGEETETKAGAEREAGQPDEAAKEEAKPRRSRASRTRRRSSAESEDDQTESTRQQDEAPPEDGGRDADEVKPSRSRRGTRGSRGSRSSSRRAASKDGDETPSRDEAEPRAAARAKTEEKSLDEPEKPREEQEKPRRSRTSRAASSRPSARRESTTKSSADAASQREDFATMTPNKKKEDDSGWLWWRREPDSASES